MICKFYKRPNKKHQLAGSRVNRRVTMNITYYHVPGCALDQRKNKQDVEDFIFIIVEQRLG
jgi:hypothetical protein